MTFANPLCLLLLLPLEWSGCGRGDYRESPLELSIGGRAVSTDFRYLGCEVLKEPPPSALPVSRGQTILAVYLEDAAAKLRLTLLYGVLPTVFTRRAILETCGSSAVHIRKCMSACTELPGDWELHTFSGGWIAEMQHTRTPVTLARTCLESTTGASSSRANPGFLLAAPDAGEQAGAVYGFNLLYSGSHYLSAQKSLQGLTRVLQGISPANFDWELAPGARFETPEAVMAYSGAGFGSLSACFHRYVNEHIIPPDWQGRPRPIVYNSWEGCMFDFNQRRLLELAAKAKNLGCELFVLDDGWFGSRNDDHAGLGDYSVNTKKLPGGLDMLSTLRVWRRSPPTGPWLKTMWPWTSSAENRSPPLSAPARCRTGSRCSLLAYNKPSDATLRMAGTWSSPERTSARMSGTGSTQCTRTAYTRLQQRNLWRRRLATDG